MADVHKATVVDGSGYSPGSHLDIFLGYDVVDSLLDAAVDMGVLVVEVYFVTEDLVVVDPGLEVLHFVLVEHPPKRVCYSGHYIHDI